MYKRASNDVALVIVAITLLAALSVGALHRNQQAQVTEASGPPCYTLHCHAMNPGHWM